MAGDQTRCNMCPANQHYFTGQYADMGLNITISTHDFQYLQGSGERGGEVAG